MNVLQTIYQARWYNDSTLLTLPHLTHAHVTALAKQGIETLPQLMLMNPKTLRPLIAKLSLNEKQVEEVIKYAFAIGLVTYWKCFLAGVCLLYLYVM
jgi:hypothetical protein